jgi:transposase
MEVLHERCCGLDVHQAVIVGCQFIKAGKQVRKEIRKFPTVPVELRSLVEWVQQSGCSLVAMESTGVYWMPVYEMLEGKIELLVANAEHMRNLPGRKTDVGDSEWIADLARHGLLRPSFIPAKKFRDLRDLTRYRSRLTQTKTTQNNRLVKQLEQAGVKLATFVSDVMGASGRQMIQALVAGKSKPAEMAQLAKGRLRQKMSDLELALDVELSENNRFLLGRQYEQVIRLEQAIDQLDERIVKLAEPYAAEIELLKTIPGIDVIASPAIIGEVGTDLSRFRDERAFSSWISVCPGNNESAGKRKHGRTRRGNLALKTLLVECAWSATRVPGYLREKYYRLRPRRGAKRALMAIAHKLAIAIYKVLTKHEPYQDLGAGYLDQRRKPTARRLVRRLEALGYHVIAPPTKAASSTPPTAGTTSEASTKKRAVRTYVLKPFTAPAAPTKSTSSNRATPSRRKAPMTTR